MGLFFTPSKQKNCHHSLFVSVSLPALLLHLPAKLYAGLMKRRQQIAIVTATVIVTATAVVTAM